ncbi:dnaJ-related protein rsp1 [Solanum lycopersicum]|uniref:J domain-containing protein n=1 Tax=Solanum lycopersicum TaxID=4081 RepID=K4AWG1_SOLLC|nr:dnaJ-related protein rsp1 [Solanum lycopersicum]
MGRNCGNWELTSEICDLSKGVPSCSHRSMYTTHSEFIDWYLLLDVDESVGVDVIKQRYRKLALQLHPDKNKHPKAHIAFKLLSQAYVCLTDEASREAFETDRRNHICTKCEKTLGHGNVAQVAKTFPPPDKARTVSRSISRHVKELKARFMEEVAVIKTCSKAKSSTSTYSMNQPQTFTRRNETPIFNPSNYELQGYPHPNNYRKLLHRFQERNTDKHVSSYPVFELRSEKEAYLHRF